MLNARYKLPAGIGTFYPFIVIDGRGYYECLPSLALAERTLAEADDPSDVKVFRLVDITKEQEKESPR